MVLQTRVVKKLFAKLLMNHIDELDRHKNGCEHHRKTAIRTFLRFLQQVNQHLLILVILFHHQSNRKLHLNPTPAPTFLFCENIDNGLNLVIVASNDDIRNDRSIVQHLIKVNYYQELLTVVMKCVNNQQHPQHRYQLHQH